MLFTSPEAIFDRIVAEGYPGIVRLANEGAEHQSLEFKTTSSAEGKVMDEDRRVLGKAISALANGSGGVIVIGIYVKGPKRDLRPIPQLLSYADHLNETIRNVVDPEISVLTERIEVPGVENQGFVVIGVPDAFPKPYMSRFDNVFYMRRSGASVAIKDTSTIRGLVTLGARPQIQVRLSPERYDSFKRILRTEGGDLKVPSYVREVLLVNTGTTPIRAIAWTVRTTAGSFDPTPAVYDLQWMQVENVSHAGGAPLERAIYSTQGKPFFPEMNLILGTLRYWPDPENLTLEMIEAIVYLEDRTERIELPFCFP